MPFFTPVVAYSPSRCYRPAPVRRDINPFISLLNHGLQEIEQAQKQQQARRTFTPRFDVWEAEESYQVEGELPGISQKDIEIQVTDEHTLIINGRIQRNDDATKPQEPSTSAKTESEKVDVARTEESVETESESDTESLPSYQATVEDDFEDLGASSDVDAGSSKKGKEKATEPEYTKTVEAQPEPEPEKQELQHQPRHWLSERFYGSFSRTFRFSDRVNADAVTASLKNGVLSIVVPKAPVPQLRKIQIE